MRFGCITPGGPALDESAPAPLASALQPLRLVCIADGWPRDVFSELLHDGRLPGISELVRDGGLMANVVSTVPSVSLVSHTSILTGTQPSEHRLPGHRWVDRDRRRVVNYLSLTGPQNVNRDIAPDVTTVFESSDGAHSVQGVIERGASLRRHLATMSGVAILEATAHRMAFHRFGTYVVWLPRVDALSHTHGPRSRHVREEIMATSRALAALTARLRRQGLYDDLEILIVPDHGHREIARHSDIASAFTGLAPRVHVNPRRYRPDAITVMTSGDSSAQVYLPATLRGRPDAVSEVAIESPDVELACWRSGDTWHYRTSTGSSRASLHQHAYSYQLIEGLDPLGILEGTCRTGTFPIDEPQLEGRYPDIVHQVANSHVDGRSGDLLLFPADGTHFGRGPRIAFRLGYHRGSHGGPTPAEVLVAAVYKGRAQRQWSHPIRSSDLLRALGFLPAAPQRAAGRAAVVPRL